MILCEELRFQYPGEPFDLRVDSLKIVAGETVALVGPSGCGKTTLLHLIAGILTPGGGGITIDGTKLGLLDHSQRQAFRLQKIGMVPQNFELLDYLTVTENILTPIRLSGSGQVSPEQLALSDSLAERSGLADLRAKYPDHLSQGERQRVALCRGLIGNPKVILADEPTGNLDPGNQDRIVALLLDEAKRREASVVMITHEPELLPRFDRVLDLREMRREACG
ncbi:MAG: ATP-binding cassette domain-containing protein [Verrucomicrobiota bacterium]